MTAPLTRRTSDHIDAVFAAEYREVVGRRLELECGAELPLWHDKTPEGLERIRFAVLKLSGGELDQLGVWLREARTDWRDCLAAAEFAEDVSAHLGWDPAAVKTERWSHQLRTRSGGTSVDDARGQAALGPQFSPLRWLIGMLVLLILAAVLIGTLAE